MLWITAVYLLQKMGKVKTVLVMIVSVLFIPMFLSPNGAAGFYHLILFV
jgi:hypothetical protein